MDTKDLTLEEGLGTEVVKKKIRKRKARSSDGKTSGKKYKGKKYKVDVNQSAVATTELSGKVVQGEVASQSCGVSPREKVDDILTDAAIGKVIESGERNDISMAENQHTTDAYMLSDGGILTVNSELVDGHTKGEVKDVPDNQTVKEALEKLDDLTGAIEQDFEKGKKTADIIMVDQEKDLQLASELVDGQITSRDDERDEGSRLAPSTVDNLQTAQLVADAEKQLEASSGLTTGTATEKKRKQPRLPFPQHQLLEEKVNIVPGTVDCVDAISKSCPISERETHGNPLIEAVQKETEMGEKFVEDVGRDNIEPDNLASHPKNHLEANSGLTTTPVTEKNKRQKKSSKDHICQPAAIALATTAPAPTTSIENVNEINGVPGNVDQLAIEKEELVQALSSELFRSAQLEELNKELSRKLEAQTKRLELLTAQKMAIDNVSPEKQQPGSSQSYKKAKLTASQSQPDEFDDELLKLDFVPVSEAN